MYFNNMYYYYKIIIRLFTSRLRFYEKTISFVKRRTPKIVNTVKLVEKC